MNNPITTLRLPVGILAPSSSRILIVDAIRSIPIVNVLASIALATIFFIDVSFESHSAIGVLYVVALALLINRSRTSILFFASLSSVLLAVDLWIVLRKPIDQQILTDKFIALIAIWVLVSALLRCKTLYDKKEIQKDQHLKVVEEMLFITSHKVRKPVCTIQGLVQIMDMSPSKEEAEHILRSIRQSAVELDEYTHELTRFIHQETRKQ